MMVLIGQFDSPFVRRVGVTLTMYELPFDRHALSVFGDRDEVLQLNPLGRVPALILDQEETLIDSTLIIDYLDDLVGSDRALTPSSGAARRQVLRLAMTATGLSERAVQLRTETIRRPPQLQSLEFVQTYHASIRKSLDVLEHDVSTPWAVGQTFSQADIAIGCCLTHLTHRVEEYAILKSWPKLSKLREACEQRDAFKSIPFPDE